MHFDHVIVVLQHDCSNNGQTNALKLYKCLRFTPRYCSGVYLGIEHLLQAL